MIPFLGSYIYTGEGDAVQYAHITYHFCQKDFLERYNALLTVSPYKQESF